MPVPSGPGAVERDGGDDVLEGVGLELLEELLHAARLELEHAGGVAATEDLVDLAVVEGDGADVEGLP
jgi:phosphoribosylformimino-5-aminoimidazole carboxamide ribonucleotide (ProFAR) isomerase